MSKIAVYAKRNSLSINTIRGSMSVLVIIHCN